VCLPLFLFFVSGLHCFFSDMGRIMHVGSSAHNILLSIYLFVCLTFSLLFFFLLHASCYTCFISFYLIFISSFLFLMKHLTFLFLFFFPLFYLILLFLFLYFLFLFSILFSIFFYFFCLKIFSCIFKDTKLTLINYLLKFYTLIIK
jgi:hypothetical protein